ncbi:MAG: cadherin repeat domain-containing protein [Gloeotrichia echinulata DEX184]|nr:cadherin repeat domain-containing protein [Gloeotrichia echinulata DEX184]
MAVVTRIIGVNEYTANPGVGEIDTLQGGTGSDRFILGNGTKVFYDDGNSTTGGSGDYALIQNFNPNEDTIQLSGLKTDYTLNTSYSLGDTALYRNKPNGEPAELIAVIKGVTALNLNSSAFATPDVFNTAKDFTLVSNPNGAWQYGYSASLTGSLTLYTETVTSPVSGWIQTIDPNVTYNGTTSKYIFGDGVTNWPSYTTAFHPGPNGEYSFYRWIAPSSGLWNVNAVFSGYSITTTDVHVLVNGASQFDDLINGSGNTKTFSKSFLVSAGNTIDFAVGLGSNGNYYYDTTGIDATITDISANQQPTDITLSPVKIPENQTIVGNFTTTDPDPGDTFTYTFVGGIGDTDNSLFTIAGNQLQAKAPFDFEAQDSYSVRVRTTDQDGSFYDKPFTITVTDLNEAPTNITLSKVKIPENQTIVGDLTTTDPDVGNTFTYSLVSGTGGTDNSLFTIVGNQVQANTSFDFETQKHSYNLRVRSTDQGGLSYDKPFTITVSNVNEPPTNISLSNTNIAENQRIGTVVGEFTTIDPDFNETFTYSLPPVIGIDPPPFIIVGNKLIANTSFDFETKNSYNLRVRTTDQGGLPYEKQFTINVTDVNEAPTDITLSQNTIDENKPIGTVIGGFTTTDPELKDPSWNETFTYSLVPGDGDTDNSKFTIVGNQLKANASFDFEAKNSYNLRVRTTDKGGLSYDKPFTINVTDVKEAPTDITLSQNTIDENKPIGTKVGDLNTTDSDFNESFTYTLVSGTGDTDNSKFTIAGNQLKANASFDFETKNSYSIRVQTKDKYGLPYEKQLTITALSSNVKYNM